MSETETAGNEEQARAAIEQQNKAAAALQQMQKTMLSPEMMEMLKLQVLDFRNNVYGSLNAINEKLDWIIRKIDQAGK